MNHRVKDCIRFNTLSRRAIPFKNHPILADILASATRLTNESFYRLGDVPLHARLDEELVSAVDEEQDGQGRQMGARRVTHQHYVVLERTDKRTQPIRDQESEVRLLSWPELPPASNGS